MKEAAFLGLLLLSRCIRRVPCFGTVGLHSCRARFLPQGEIKCRYI